VEPDDLLVGKSVAAAVYGRVRSCLAEFGPFEVRTTKSQIAFRRKRGFAYLWLPGQYLSNADAEVVLPSPSGATTLRNDSRKSRTPPRGIGCTISSFMDPTRWTAKFSDGSAKPSNVLADSRPRADRGQGDVAWHGTRSPRIPNRRKRIVNDPARRLGIAELVARVDATHPDLNDVPVELAERLDTLQPNWRRIIELFREDVAAGDDK